MMIQDDGEEDYSVSVTMQLDCDEFNQVISHSISATSNPYDLQNYNCTDYGIEIANCVGLGVEETTSPWIFNGENYGSSRNPGDLGGDIKNLSTGTINQNGGKGPVTNCK